MASEQLDDRYPAERNATGSSRLRAQHDLVVHVLGGLLLCALDTARENLRILDIGIADGWCCIASVMNSLIRNQRLW